MPRAKQTTALLLRAYDASARGEWKEAVSIMEPLALEGVADAEHYLGWCFEQGIEKPRDMALAYSWWLKAAAKGVPESQYAVAMLSEEGRGTNKDIVQAYMWYVRAAFAGLPEAAQRIPALKIQLTESDLRFVESVLQREA